MTEKINKNNNINYILIFFYFKQLKKRNLKY